MFSIDHAAFIAQLETWWDFINTGGFAYWIITALCGYGIYRIVASLFDNDGPDEVARID